MSVVVMRRVLVTLAAVGVLLLLSSMVAGAATRRAGDLTLPRVVSRGPLTLRPGARAPRLLVPGGALGQSSPCEVALGAHAGSGCTVRPCRVYLATPVERSAVDPLAETVRRAPQVIRGSGGLRVPRAVQVISAGRARRCGGPAVPRMLPVAAAG